ncbi:MAG: DUF3575 domain-containing protein [Prevotella sp.]|nr:DUF3575 domain-containing protein [Prevotella sp.]
MRVIVAHIAHRASVSVMLIAILFVMRTTTCNAERTDTCRTTPLFAIRTNTLYDAFLIPNIGAEMQIGNDWTVQLDWFYTWFSSDNRHRYWQGYGGYVTVKKYFNFEWITDAPMIGHHVGFYLSGLTYDVEWGGKGYQASKFGFGGGVEYGYSCHVSRNMKLDFTLGLGFQDGEYKEYEPSNDHYNHYVWLATKKRHWWGPTKLEVSLAWFLGGKKKNKVSIESVNPVDPIGNNRKGGGL